MKNITSVLILFITLTGLSWADFGLGAVDYGNAQTSNTSSSNISTSDIEQTSIDIHAAGGIADFGSGVQVSQHGIVDADAKPESLEVANSTQNHASEYATGQGGNVFNIIPATSGSESSSSTTNTAEAKSAIPASGSVNQVFNGTDQGGASAINTVDADGNVNTNNVTSHTPIIAASQAITGEGNTYLEGNQNGSAMGHGSAAGLAGNIQYSNTDTHTSNTTENSASNTASVFPVAFGAWSFIPGNFGN